MHGAIAGNFIGSKFEKSNTYREGVFLFGDACHYTAGTVMTAAVAEALIKAVETGAIDCEADVMNEKKTKKILLRSLRRWGRRYHCEGYDSRSFFTLKKRNAEPYSIRDNGPAASVSPAGWLFSDIMTTRKAARLTAAATHDDPEGVKGAEAAASAVFLARTGHSKYEIRHYLSAAFEYDFTRTCDEIRQGHTSELSCHGGVPEAVISFLEGRSCEDTIRNAVSLGRDSEVIAAIAGAIAEAYYGTDPEWMMFKEAERKLPEDLRDVMHRFDKFKSARLEEMEIIEKDDISRARIRLMSVTDAQIVKAYMRDSSVSRIAEETGKTEQEVLRVLHLAQYYNAIYYKLGKRTAPGVIWYINSMITKSAIETLWLIPRDKPRKISLACGFGFKEPEELVVGIMENADKLPADVEELSGLTGYHRGRMKMALNRVLMQMNLAKSRREILRSFREDGETHD